ncbi:hypothetical protein FB451DRAFT_1560208 [Mycena latifolia]|nr:hypothetical protein FB451DRAFT_1560208 [Mycena latifolia]
MPHAQTLPSWLARGLCMMRRRRKACSGGLCAGVNGESVSGRETLSPVLSPATPRLHINSTGSLRPPGSAPSASQLQGRTAPRYPLLIALDPFLGRTRMRSPLRQDPAAICADLCTNESAVTA